MSIENCCSPLWECCRKFWCPTQEEREEQRALLSAQKAQQREIWREEREIAENAVLPYLSEFTAEYKNRTHITIGCLEGKWRQFKYSEDDFAFLLARLKVDLDHSPKYILSSFYAVYQSQRPALHSTLEGAVARITRLFQKYSLELKEARQSATRAEPTSTISGRDASASAFYPADGMSAVHSGSGDN